MTAVAVEPRDLAEHARQWLDDPDVDVLPRLDPPRRALIDELEHRDAQISRCGRCGEWRYRATSTACQTCRAPAIR